MEQNQTPIICDVNIWYWISEGRIPLQTIEDKRLVGTFMNAHEFCFSQNTHKDYSRLRKAVIAFDQYVSEICMENPVETIKLVSGYESDDSMWAELDMALMVIVNSESLSSDLARQEQLTYANEMKLNNKPFLDSVNQHRDKIIFKGEYKKEMNLWHRRQEHLEHTKEVITAFLGGLVPNWDRLNLFLYTFDEWLRQLALQSTLTMTLNDWNDVMNLVYVQPGSLYWTEDNKKTKRFIRDCGCSHYLYQNN